MKRREDEDIAMESVFGPEAGKALSFDSGQAAQDIVSSANSILGEHDTFVSKLKFGSLEYHVVLNNRGGNLKIGMFFTSDSSQHSTGLVGVEYEISSDGSRTNKSFSNVDSLKEMLDREDPDINVLNLLVDLDRNGNTNPDVLNASDLTIMNKALEITRNSMQTQKNSPTSPTKFHLNPKAKVR